MARYRPGDTPCAVTYPGGTLYARAPEARPARWAGPAQRCWQKFSASVIFNENGHFWSHVLVKPITNQAFAGSGHNEPGLRWLRTP